MSSKVELTEMGLPVCGLSAIMVRGQAEGRERNWRVLCRLLSEDMLGLDVPLMYCDGLLGYCLLSTVIARFSVPLLSDFFFTETFYLRSSSKYLSWSWSWSLWMVYQTHKCNRT